MKPTQDPPSRSASPTFVERRSFIRNAGAALSASLAVSATAAGSEHKPDSPGADANAIRELHHNFVELLNTRRYEDLRELFANDPQAVRPYVEQFERRLPENVQRPVHDFLVGHAQHLDSVEVSPDRQHASARFHCLTRIEAALSATHPLVEMARQQGQGVLPWWESGVLENTYVKLPSGWKISRLAFRSSGQWPARSEGLLEPPVARG